MNVIKFDAPISAREAESEIVDAVKDALYKYAGVITVAQALGCLEIVKQEICQQETQE